MEMSVAVESADLVLIENDLLDAVKALVLAKKAYGKMIQNLFWATGYNRHVSAVAAYCRRSGSLLNPWK